MSALDLLGGAGPGPGGPGGGAPPSIPLPGGGGPSGPGPDAAAGGGKPGPDTPDVEKAIQDALLSLEDAKSGENDAEDKAFLAKVIADLHKFLGDQQKLMDTVMGGGPGSKIIRKATGTPSPSAPSGPGGY